MNNNLVIFSREHKYKIPEINNLLVKLTLIYSFLDTGLALYITTVSDLLPLSADTWHTLSLRSLQDCKTPASDTPENTPDIAENKNNHIAL